MVEYNCEICGKNFGNKKCNYQTHINKKFPCKPKSQSNTLEHITAQKNTLNKKVNTNTNKQAQNNEITIYKQIPIIISNQTKSINNKPNPNPDKQFKCEYCSNTFTRNTSLTRHLEGGFCKVKKQNENDEKKKIDELIELNKQLIKQNEDIKKELSQIKKCKNTNDIKIGNVNNINNIKNENINIQINNYGTENYADMDKKLFLEPMLKEIGKQIFLKMIKNVYLNPEFPENHNIVITDKNRQICKIYNDNRWITTDINMINDLLSRIIYFAKEKCIEYKDHPKQTEKIKARLNTTKKYIDKCDPDFLAELTNELEEGNKENKKRIKECEEFYEMMYNDTINLLHDFKDIVLKK
jgi:hypothetical protein